MGRRLSSLMAAIVMVVTSVASAHPMGNFSISHHSSITVDRDRIHIRYRIDIAEIPTFQEMPTLDTNGDKIISAAESKVYAAHKATEWIKLLDLKVDGKDTPLSIVDSDLVVRPGAGGLPTLLVTVNLLTNPLSIGRSTTIDYIDGNYPGRAGWREIVVIAGAGIRLTDSNASSTDRSDGLQKYPADALAAPPQQSATRFVIELSSTAAAQTPVAASSIPAAASVQPTSGRPRDALAALIERKDSSWGFLFISLAVAFVLGCGHALAPGHGKTVVGAYLVGSRGTPRHAVLLGLVVTTTHTIGVFALGFVVLFASRYVLPESLYPWLGFISGMAIASIGGWQLIRRLEATRAGMPVGHLHGPGGHTHAMPDRITPASLLALGVSGGMVPCPSALLLLLAAIALHRVGMGLVLILAFSMGLAAVLMTVGMLMLSARRAIEKLQFQFKAARFLPVAASAAISLLGFGVAFQSLFAAGMLQKLW